MVFAIRVIIRRRVLLSTAGGAILFLVLILKLANVHDASRVLVLEFVGEEFQKRALGGSESPRKEQTGSVICVNDGDGEMEHTLAY